MKLSSNLISRFVKLNKVEEKKPSETTVYGTVAMQEGTSYVKLDGSDLLTPVSTTTDIQEGDRVTVMIKNHQAVVTGNITSPAAKNSTVIALDADLDGKVSVEELEAEKVRITNSLEAHKAEIDSLKTKKLDVSVATANFATVKELTAMNASVDKLKGQQADFEQVTAKKFTSIDAAIKNLSVEGLDATYATIDFSNIGKAAMEYFYANSGLIKNVTVGDQTITGELVGVTINGDRLIGNTVIAEKLVIKGSDGLYYKLNTDGMVTEAEQTDENSLNGSIIKAKSITASKISVTDLVAFDATIGGFHITEDSIYSGVKESVNNTTRGIFFNNDGEFAVGDSDNFIKYYQDSTGKWRLAMIVDSLEITGSEPDDDPGSETDQQIIVGGRNLYTGTRDFDGPGWGNMEHWETWDVSDDIGYREYGRYGAWLGLCQDISVKAGEVYTFSFYARGSSSAEISIYNTQNHTETTPGSLYVGPIPDEYIRYHFTFTVNEDCIIAPRVENMTDDGWVQIYGLKLEKGNVPTDWSPAPEDVDLKIEEASKVATNFMGYTADSGLQLGNKIGGSWSGFRTQITSTAFNILNSAGTALASYGAKLIELGKSATDAIIKFCGGKGQIEYVSDDSNEYFQMSSEDSVRIKSSVMSSLYATYTDQTSKWEKSAVNVSTTNIHMYASECIEPTLSDMLEGWNTSEIYLRSGSVDILSPGNISLTSQSSDNSSYLKVKPRGIELNSDGNIALLGTQVFDNFGVIDSVEKGSSGIWTYRKYSSGHVELAGVYNVSNKACSTALGSMYRTDAFGVGSFPFTVYDPKLTASYESAGYGAMLWATSVTSTTQPPSYYLVRPTSATIASGKVIFHVTGRWK